MTARKTARIVNLLRDTRGANMVEYIIIVGLIAVIAIVGFTAFGSSVRTVITGQSSTIGNIPTQ